MPHTLDALDSKSAQAQARLPQSCRRSHPALCGARAGPGLWLQESPDAPILRCALTQVPESGFQDLRTLILGSTRTSNRSGMPAIYGVVAAAEVDRLAPLHEMGAGAQGEGARSAGGGCEGGEGRGERVQSCGPALIVRGVSVGAMLGCDRGNCGDGHAA